MSITKLSDIVNPEVLAMMVSAKYPDQMVFGPSNPLVKVDTEFGPGTPGTTRTIPFYHQISDFTSMTEGVALIPGKVTTGKENYLIQRAGLALGATDIARLVAVSDPMTEMAIQLAKKAARYIDSALVSEIEHTPNTFDQTGTSQTNTNGTFDQNVIVNAMVTLGDNYDVLLNGGQLIVHSKVWSDLLKLGYIQNQYQSGGDVARTGLVPTLMGLPIRASDRCKVETVNSKVVYHSYIVGPESLMLGYQRELDVEMGRDILLKADIISADVHFAAHLFGYDALTNTVVADQNKSIHAVVVKSF